jgi:hypothetical protein
VLHSPDWTVREAVAHVVTAAPRSAAGPERCGTWVRDPRGLPELNDAEIRALGTRDMDELAGTGRTSPSPCAGPGRSTPDHVALILDGLAPDPARLGRPDQARGLTATFEVRLRGQATHAFAFQDGRLQVDPDQPRRVDAHISADPAALVLVIYRRRSQWPKIAAAGCWPGAAGPGWRCRSSAASTSRSRRGRARASAGPQVGDRAGGAGRPCRPRPVSVAGRPRAGR